MATINPFDLLGDVDSDDPSQLLLAAQQQKIVSKKSAAPAAVSAHQAPAKLPTKPLPPAQAVREARVVRNNPGSASAGHGGTGRGRGGREGMPYQNRDYGNGSVAGGTQGYEDANGSVSDKYGDFGKSQERYRSPRQPFTVGRRGGYGGRGGYRNGEIEGDSERLQGRIYERRSGTGQSYEMKRGGAGRGNWGAATDGPIEPVEIVKDDDKTVEIEKHMDQDEVNKDSKAGTTEEKEEDKEMTLEAYERVKEEKRKALRPMKNEERKVEIDEELQSMQQLSGKKTCDEVFVKLGADKETAKKKESSIDREEKIKKPMRVTDFLKPAEGERYYTPGRGRGRGGRGPYGVGGGGGLTFPSAAPAIEDRRQFPTLGGK